MVSHCVRGAVDDLPYVTGRMFERWYLSGPENDYQVRAARSMVDRVIDATRRGFLELRWIDEPTRRHVVERIDDLELIVGLPHNLSTDAQLDDHHSYLSQVDTDEDTYPDMMWALRRAMVEARLRLLNASLSPPSAAVTLNMPMLLVNAFYVPSEHVIAIPLAIMLPPFQQRGLPAALNYGSLGHVIGHEITHSCDEHVSPLNESGTHIDPWSEQSRANFRERLRCLRRLYNQHGAGASVAFGDTAMTENFADCGGMDKSLRALRALGPLSSQRLADREFSAEQLFFVASCYKWCSPVQSGAAGGSAEVSQAVRAG
ncbi:hypothetical protein HPB48_006737 [Haemaphysalis longicornis]|uniref:Peptidase M13 C-terminal domain-containing protein n=1 Tax=Haemaphysalis longicornis TaxID=44386 RepID=A0A9J6G6L5_HAELO|nr:hypothetical protein HPB48_006737 [Haemaphysalis longicornis]